MKGKGKGQDPTRDTAWNSSNPYKGKGKGQKGYWKGGQGKGAYSMEDDWSSGYSGYSYDTPLFISSLAQEAQGEWQKVNPKKAARQSNCSAHTACQGHIHKGRYDVLSDCNYNPFFSDFDTDFDLPSLMMTSSEKGDVPPGIASPGVAVFVHEAATAEESREFPLLSAKVPTRHEDKSIAQRNLAAAKKIWITYLAQSSR